MRASQDVWSERLPVFYIAFCSIMGLYTKLPDTMDEVGVIIAGGQYPVSSQPTFHIVDDLGVQIGGTAGCVVAARLADADPGLPILVIEGGPNNEIPTVEIPASFLAHLAPDSKIGRFYMAKKSPEVADRSLTLPTGNILGGGSSINFMMYSRAQRSDWDSWNTPGWSADEMLPFLKKVSRALKSQRPAQLLELMIALAVGDISRRRCERCPRP